MTLRRRTAAAVVLLFVASTIYLPLHLLTEIHQHGLETPPAAVLTEHDHDHDPDHHSSSHEPHAAIDHHPDVLIFRIESPADVVLAACLPGLDPAPPVPAQGEGRRSVAISAPASSDLLRSSRSRAPPASL